MGLVGAAELERRSWLILRGGLFCACSTRALLLVDRGRVGDEEATEKQPSLSPVLFYARGGILVLFIFFSEAHSMARTMRFVQIGVPFFVDRRVSRPGVRT